NKVRRLTGCKFKPVENRRFVCTWIIVRVIVRKKSLTGNKVAVTVSIDVDQVGGMGLRCRLMQFMGRPSAGAIGVHVLLVPPYSVAMRRSTDDIVEAITVDIHDMHL